MLPSPPLASELEPIAEKLPPLHIVSPELDIVPELNALRAVTVHDPVDAVKLVLHVPSFASLVYTPAPLLILGSKVAEFELASTLEPFFHW